METDCEKCLHQKVCALWGAHESQDASCFSLDGCDYFEAALTPPNEPLTLAELREMNGEPVWVSYPNRIGKDRWYIIEKSTKAGLHVESHPHFYLGWDTYGKFWLAFRRPPEGEEERHGD